MAQLQPLPNPGKSKPLQALDLIDFTGGVNLTDDMAEVLPNQVRDCRNVDFDPDGGFSLRRGIDTTIAATGSGSSGFYFQKANRIVHDIGSGTSVYASNGGSWTTLTTSISNGTALSRYNAAELGDYCYWGNGTSTGVTYRWDGAAASATALTASAAAAWQESYSTPSGTHFPRSNYKSAHNNMMWCAETNEDATSRPYRVRWSHPGDAGSWRSNDYIDITDGGFILGIASFREVLLVFKTKSVWAITGFDAGTFTVVKISDTGVGPYNSNAKGWCVGDDAAYFSNPGVGIWRIDSSFALTKISRNIEVIFNSLSLTSVDMQFGGGVRRRLFVGFSPSQVINGTTCRMAVWDPELDAWSLWDFPIQYQVSQFTLLSTDSGLYGSMKAVGNGELISFETNTVTDDLTGSANVHIDGWVTTGWFAPGSIAQKKTWKRPELLYRATSASSFTLTSYVDWNGTADKTMTFSQSGSGSNYDIDRGTTMGQARAVSVTIAGPTATDTAWSVDGVVLKYRGKPLR